MWKIAIAKLALGLATGYALSAAQSKSEDFLGQKTSKSSHKLVGIFLIAGAFGLASHAIGGFLDAKLDTSEFEQLA